MKVIRDAAMALGSPSPSAGRLLARRLRRGQRQQRRRSTLHWRSANVHRCGGEEPRPFSMEERAASGRGERVSCNASSGRGFGRESGAEPSAESVDSLVDEIVRLYKGAKMTALADVTLKNIRRFDQPFWLNIADRVDRAASEEEKDMLRTLSSTLMNAVEQAMEQSEKMTEKSGALLESIVNMGADAETGEFSLPLTAEKLLAIKSAVEERFDEIDEPTISTAYTIMEKAAKDGQDAIVSLLQHVLRTYAAIALSTKVSKNGDGILSSIILMDPDEWVRELQKGVESNEISEDGLKEQLQTTMEELLFSFPVGSFTQRLFAEFLKEFEDRSKKAFNNAST